MSEMRSNVLADRLAGMRNRDIAQKYGITPLQVGYHLRKAVRYGEVSVEVLNLRTSKEPIDWDDYNRKWIERVRARTVVTDRSCWVWQGTVNYRGYGQTSYNGLNASVHRQVYLILRGPIPDKWDVCHTCDNPACCQPLHLFAAPRVANLIDMRNKGRNRQTQKTHCPKGHDYAIYGKPHYSKPTWRMCTLCNLEKSRENIRLGKTRIWQRARRERQKAALSETSAPGKTAQP